MWSNDIYSRYIRKDADDRQRISAGKNAIILSLFTSLIFGLILLHLKFESPDSAFTHTLNNLRYYIICGVVVLVCTAILVSGVTQHVVLNAAIITIPLNIGMQLMLPDMNYFVRAFWVIATGLVMVLVFGKGRFNPILSMAEPANPMLKRLGWIGVVSLLLLHVVFH